MGIEVFAKVYPQTHKVFFVLIVYACKLHVILLFESILENDIAPQAMPTR